jgi:hypothetical protein
MMHLIDGFNYLLNPQSLIFVFYCSVTVSEGRDLYVLRIRTCIIGKPMTLLYGCLQKEGKINVKLSPCLTKHDAIKMYGEVGV